MDTFAELQLFWYGIKSTCIVNFCTAEDLQRLIFVTMTILEEKPRGDNFTTLTWGTSRLHSLVSEVNDLTTLYCGSYT